MMDLEIRPSRARPVSAEVVREVEEADLALLSLPRDAKPQAIKKIRSSHHALAKNIALGFTNEHCSAITGYDPGYISILKGDPTFQELVAHYQANVDLAFTDFASRMGIAGSLSLEEIIERLEDEEMSKEIGVHVLLDVAKMAADRLGHGPKQTNEVNVTVGFADRLQAARLRVKQGESECKTIDLSASTTSHETAPAGFPPDSAEPREEPVA